MARQFKPVRFFVMMGTAAFIVCGVTAFYTHRAAHGRTEQAPRDSKLPTAAELNMMAQKYSRQHGTGNQQNWNLGFENRYSDGFNKTHPQ